MEDNKIMELENLEDMEVTETENETQGKGFLGKLAIGSLIAGVAGLIVYKNRDKIEKRRIEKLRKKGYVIYEPGEIEDDESTVEVDD